MVINLPKLKTHVFTLYTGAVKNLFGAIPGNRKRQAHVACPGVEGFSRVLVDMLELIRPGLTVLDGVLGQEGNGPGGGGTPHRYACLAASEDPVALDAMITQAMGYRPGDVLHLREAGDRKMGTSDPDTVHVKGDRQTLNFGAVRLPSTHWYFLAPAWVSVPLRRMSRLRPRLATSVCDGCGRCATICPRNAITPGQFPVFDQDRCIGCFCCSEVCSLGAIKPHGNLFARLVGMGRL